MKILYTAACLGLMGGVSAGPLAAAQDAGLELDLDDGSDEIELQLRSLIQQAVGEEVIAAPQKTESGTIRGASDAAATPLSSGEVLAIEGDIRPGAAEVAPQPGVSDEVTGAPRIIRSEDGRPPVPLLSPSEREAADVGLGDMGIGEAVEAVVDTTSVTLLEGEELIVEGADRAEGWLERRVGSDFPKWLGVLLALPVFLLSTYLLLRAMLSGGRAERFQGRHRLDGVEVGEAVQVESKRTVTRHSMKASRDQSRSDRSLGVIRDPDLSKLEHAIKADWRSETAKEPEAKTPVVRKKDQKLARTTIIRAADLDTDGAGVGFVPSEEELQLQEEAPVISRPGVAKKQLEQRSQAVVKRAPREGESGESVSGERVRRDETPRELSAESRQKESSRQEGGREPLSEEDTLAIMERIRKIAQSGPGHRH